MVHILVATYMFVGLAIVCDDFFVPALTRVSDGKNQNLQIFLNTIPRISSAYLKLSDLGYFKNHLENPFAKGTLKKIFC